MPPPVAKIDFIGNTRAEDVCAVVLTVRVEETAAVVPAAMLAVVGESEHVGKSVAPDGLVVSAQVRATSPVKPPVGVIVIVDVPDPPCVPTVIAVGEFSVKPATGTAVTVRPKLNICEMLPDTPVTMIE